MTKDEALKMAIEALMVGSKIADTFLPSDDRTIQISKAINACKEALKPHPDCDEACMYQCEHERKHEALATNEESSVVQPSQEPVAEVIEDRLADWSKPHVAVKWNKVDFDIGTKFYTHPAPQPAQETVMVNVKTHDDTTYKVEVSTHQWQGLTDDEIYTIEEKCIRYRDDDVNSLNSFKFARAIEQALKEKNHA